MRRIICRTLAVLFASSLSLTALAQTAQFQGQVTDPQQAVRSKQMAKGCIPHLSSLPAPIRYMSRLQASAPCPANR